MKAFVRVRRNHWHNRRYRGRSVGRELPGHGSERTGTFGHLGSSAVRADEDWYLTSPGAIMSWLCESTVGAWCQFLTVKSVLAPCLSPRHYHPYRRSVQKSPHQACAGRARSAEPVTFYAALEYEWLLLGSTTAANTRAIAVAHTPAKGTEFFQVEQYALGTLTHVARNYLGPKWRPRRIAIASTPSRAGNLTIARACEELVVGASYAAIEVPIARLHEGPSSLPNSLQAPGHQSRPFPLDVLGILTQMLRWYFPDYPMTLDEVSAILQIHPRTLNRRIEKQQISFRDVRNQILIERAKLKLTETDRPLSKISTYLGYANQSAFSRAFTKAVGVSPLKYRIEHSR